MEGLEGSIPFEKWEGLGNDFILIEARHVRAPPSAAAIATLCDRHTGVGADGVLLVDRSTTTPSMVVRNADGSRPEMCGNGLRCVAAYVFARDAAPVIAIETDAGTLACFVEIPPSSAAGYLVEATMGKAREGAPLEVAFEGGRHVFATVSMGNPHAVTFDPYADEAFDRIAPIVERAIQGGTNVERVCVANRQDILDVTVWERGVGYTRACGTGACAVAVAACRLGRARFDSWQTIHLPGGDLAIWVAAESLDVRMRGPARRVFSGTI